MANHGWSSFDIADKSMLALVDLGWTEPACDILAISEPGWILERLVGSMAIPAGPCLAILGHGLTWIDMAAHGWIWLNKADLSILARLCSGWTWRPMDGYFNSHAGYSRVYLQMEIQPTKL